MAKVILNVDGGKSGDPKPSPPGKIPLPDYKNPESRLKYAQAFRDKYGSEYLKGYGDIPLRINERPFWGTDTSKNLAIKEAKRLGLNPALFYASSMIEGQSGLYSGADKTLQKGFVKTTGDKDYPVSGMWNFGLDSFMDYLPALKQKGYIPQDFDKNFKIWDKPGSPSGANFRPESVMFKNTDSGIQAKAAMMRSFYDELDDYAKKGNVKLTPEQRDYFALAHFNSGAHGYELLDAYNKSGLLKNGDFLKKQPDVPIQQFVDFYKKRGSKNPQADAAVLHKQIYSNVIPRMLAAKGLTNEGYFDEDKLPESTATPASKVMLQVRK